MVVVPAQRALAVNTIIKMEVESNKTTNTQNTKGTVIREHNVEIVSGGNVFYNPVQEFNRDLSIAVLNVYFQRLLKDRREKLHKKLNKSTAQPETNEEASEPKVEASEPKEFVATKKYDNGLRILEALSATGLRSIRYAREIAGVREIVANDLSKEAVDSIRINIEHNAVKHLIEPSHADAMTVMYLSTSPEKRFDAVDLDPYGCPNRFLDGAVQCIADGGLLLVTATDMAVLAGNSPETCFSKYGSVPLRMKCCHEMALRILLNCIEGHANRYGKFIEPLLSISADFYIRIFVRVFTSQAKCKLSMSKQSMIYQCTGCDTYTLQPLGILKPNPTASNPQQVKYGIPTGPPVGTNCQHCEQKHHVGGPIWSAPIHDTSFVEELLNTVQKPPLESLGTQRRIVGMLSMVLEELQDVPLYYTPDKLCNVLKMEIMPMMKFRSVLLYAGYRVSYSHASKNSLKTDAPTAIIWDILRSWNKLHPVKAERLKDNKIIKTILDVPPTQDYNFDKFHAAANPNSRRNALSRFQENPTPHWGPGTRATIMIGDNKLPKCYLNQNKKTRHKSKFQTTNDVSTSEDTSAVAAAADAALAEDDDDAQPSKKKPKLSSSD